MSLDKIREDKIKEAIELYKKLGIDSSKGSMPEMDELFSSESKIDLESPKKKEKLHWTRLSINSNFGCVVD